MAMNEDKFNEILTMAMCLIGGGLIVIAFIGLFIVTLLMIAK